MWDPGSAAPAPAAEGSGAAEAKACCAAAIGAAAAPASAWGATAAGTWGWPSTFRRKPERSTSSPWSRRSATSSMSSLICSNGSKTQPPSNEIFLQEQTRPPELEPGAAEVPVRPQHEEQIIIRGDGADHQGHPLRGDGELLDLPDRQLPVVVRDGPRLGDHLRAQRLQVDPGVRADRLDRDAILRHQGEGEGAVD